MRVCLDLFAGLGGFSGAFEDAAEWEVVTVDIEDRFDPDICADVLDFRPSDLPEADVVLASPPCKAFSMAAHGTHLDGDGRPVSDWGAESLALVHHTVGLIKALDPDYWILENPMGGMRRQLGRPDAHVWWCQYGSDRAKPTDLWGRLPASFIPKRCYRNSPECDHQRAPRGSDSGTDASGLTPETRAKVPYGLSEAIREAVHRNGSTPEWRETDHNSAVGGVEPRNLLNTIARFQSLTGGRKKVVLAALELIAQGVDEIKRKDIENHLNADELTRWTINRGLDELVADGVLNRKKHGKKWHVGSPPSGALAADGGFALDAEGGGVGE